MYLDKIIFDNSVESWLLSSLIILTSFLILKATISITGKKIKKLSLKTDMVVDDIIAVVFEKTRSFFLFFLAIYFGSLVLNIPDTTNSAFNSVLVLAVILQTALWGIAVINFVSDYYKNQKLEQDAASVTTFSALAFFGKLLIWSLVLLLALDNLGFNITTLITGLGIGGIAIALAVQNILGDLFASLSIVMDKPFVLGDFIIVDTHMGNVEHIGLKTTRIRSISGEQLIFSNNDLLKSRIRNFKRMTERRIVFRIGVVYQTAKEKLEIIPAMLQKIIEQQEHTRFDRAHFKEFGDFSLNFEIVYWLDDSDYKLYMETQQKINLQIFEQFKQNQIEFAYPTQTVIVDKT